MTEQTPRYRQITQREHAQLIADLRSTYTIWTRDHGLREAMIIATGGRERFARVNDALCDARDAHLVSAFPVSTEFLRRLDAHDLSDSAFRCYLELVASATSRSEPSVHELSVFVHAVMRGESTHPYPASAIELLRVGLLTDVYTARGDLHALLVADAIPHAIRSSRHRRSIDDDLRQSIYDRDGRRCLICGSTRDLTLDHIIPWSLGGPDDETNLETLCGSCNSRKGDRPRRCLTTSSVA